MDVRLEFRLKIKVRQVLKDLIYKGAYFLTK
jgi:hypothetical protein